MYSGYRVAFRFSNGAGPSVVDGTATALTQSGRSTNMKALKGGGRKPLVGSLATVWLLIAARAGAQIPNIDAPHETNVQFQGHFLQFLGSFILESPTSAAAYYKAIDPGGKKVTFTQWLVAAGFIGQESDWRSTGKQVIACGKDAQEAATLGCDLPKRDGSGNLRYGPNIVNTDSHVIVLNAADLGFVRNQFIRCAAQCTTRHPILYTYLENYPVFPFTDGGTNFGKGDGTGAGFPSPAEADAAIQSAITRPDVAGLQRIADVAFDWAPPQKQPTSTSRFGQLYAYIFHEDGSGNITETRNWPADQDFLDKLNARTGVLVPLFPVKSTDPFAPELDARGFKQMPGLCLVCHGGKPQNVLSTGSFPHGGVLDGFRFLPLDATNLLFVSSSSDPLSRPKQEAAMKVYNQEVLMTVDQSKEGDGTGTTRGPHLAEVIKGWYAGFLGDQNMTAPTQNDNFVPQGWAGHENLYLKTVAPNCRSCHFNREISLDFGTYANFHQESDILQLALKPQCDTNSPDPRLKPMPLAYLTYQRYWSNATDPNAPNNFDLPGLLAKDFGFSSTAGYCATGP